MTSRFNNTTIHILLGLSLAASALPLQAVEPAPEKLEELRNAGRTATGNGRIHHFYWNTVMPAIKAYEKDSDIGHLQAARAAVQGVLDCWIQANRDIEQINPGGTGHGYLPSEFFHRGPMMESYLVMRDAGVLDATFEADFRELVEQHFTVMERGPNNRAASYAIGCALAVKAWADSPKTAEWTAYAEAVWNDWYGPGDTYEPSYVRHHVRLLELGQVLGKDEELKSEKMQQTYDRYLSQVSSSGHCVTSGDGGAYAAPEMSVLMEKIMEVCPQPRYLWGLKKTWLWEPGRTENDFAAAYPQYRDLEARAPDWGAQVVHQWPATYRHPDRLVLAPSRRDGAPYAAFWIADWQNFLYHGGVADTRGDLAHYEADGVLLRADRGRYDWPAWNSTFVVSEPDAEFPFRRTEGLHAGRWYRGSSDFREARVYMPSENYVLHAEKSSPQHFGFQDKKVPYGYMWGNPDAPAGRNDTIALNEVRLEFALLRPEGEAAGKVFPGRTWWGGYEYRNVCPSDKPVDVLIRNLFVAGPAGEIIIDPLDALHDGLTLTFIPPRQKGETEFQEQPLTGAELAKFVKVVADPETGRPALRLTTRYGRTVLQVNVDNLKLDVNQDYNRLGLDYRYATPIRNWTRTPIHLGINGSQLQDNLKLDRQQGGILTDAVAENHDEEDSYAHVSYTSIWTHDSNWTRRAILTREGILVVRDEFTPGQAADGMIAGPVWRMPSAPQAGSFNTRNPETADWFDAAVAAPRDSQSYRSDHGEKNMHKLVVFEPVPGRVNGSQYQPKHWNANDYAVYSRQRLTAGQTTSFMSVLIPHTPKLDPAKIINNGRGVRIETNPDGVSVVQLNVKDELWPHPALTIHFGPVNKWSVTRQ